MCVCVYVHVCMCVHMYMYVCIYIHMQIHMYICKSKHPRCKKGVAKYWKGLVEKDVKSKWAAKASYVWQVKSFGQHCFIACSSFLIPSTSGVQNNNVLSEVIVTKIFNLSKSRRPWPPISISHLSNKAFKVLGRSFGLLV